MRRKALLVAALPAASAVSLANFQPLSWSKVPPICEMPYYAQIPSCAPADFHGGCSPMCEMALEAVAANVISSCSNAPAPPNSLLAAILEGGIVNAVCPPKSSPEPPMKPPPMQPPPMQPPPVETSAPDVVTIPTASPGVQVTTTTTSSSSPSTTPQAQPPPSPPPPQPSPPAPSSTSCATTDLPQPTASLEGVTRVSVCAAASAPPPAVAQTTPTENAPQPTVDVSPTSAASTSQANSGENSGSGSGGAPFALGGNLDETGSASSNFRGGSVLALVVAACACVML